MTIFKIDRIPGGLHVLHTRCGYDKTISFINLRAQTHFNPGNKFLDTSLNDYYSHKEWFEQRIYEFVHAIN